MQLGQQINRRKVVHGEKISSFRTGSRPIVPSSAWLHTAPTQTAFATQVAAEQTKSRITETKGTVHEHLKFNLGLLRNSTDLLNGKLTGQYHTFEAHLGKLLDSQGVMGAKQSAGMKPEFRKKAFTELIKTQVLDYQTVRPEFGE
jgi:hypothetical protein